MINVQGLDGLPYGSFLLDATFIVVQLQFLPHLPLLKVGCFNDLKVHMVPLLRLLVATTLAKRVKQQL